MKAVGVTELRESLSEVTGKVKYGHERITILNHGKPACVIVCLEDLELLEAIEEHIDIEEANKALKRNKFIEWNQALKQLGLENEVYD